MAHLRSVVPKKKQIVNKFIRSATKRSRFVSEHGGTVQSRERQLTANWWSTSGATYGWSDVANPTATDAARLFFDVGIDSVFLPSNNRNERSPRPRIFLAAQVSGPCRVAGWRADGRHQNGARRPRDSSPGFGFSCCWWWLCCCCCCCCCEMASFTLEQSESIRFAVELIWDEDAFGEW